MTMLIKIGNSQGIRIPKPLIKQAHLDEAELDFEVTEKGLLIKPVQKLSRKGWFDNYDAKKDVEPLSEMVELNSEQEDWKW